MPKVGKWGLAFLLFFTYMMGEFAHWLPVVSSEALANTFKFGDVKCVKVSNKTDTCQDWVFRLHLNFGFFLLKFV